MGEGSFRAQRYTCQAAGRNRKQIFDAVVSFEVGQKRFICGSGIKRLRFVGKRPPKETPKRKYSDTCWLARGIWESWIFISYRVVITLIRFAVQPNPTNAIRIIVGETITPIGRHKNAWGHRTSSLVFCEAMMSLICFLLCPLARCIFQAPCLASLIRWNRFLRRLPLWGIA